MAELNESWKRNSKPLPRGINGAIESSFEANGNKYYILSAEDGISINRWLVYKKYGLEAATGLSMSSLYSKMTDFESLLRNNESMYQLSVSFAEMKKSLLDLSEERFDKGLYFCTTFIIREGEDVKTWNKAEAEDKIKDWAEEGFSIFDFFTLVVSSDKNLTNEFNRLQSQAMAVIPDQYLKAHQDYTQSTRRGKRLTNTRNLKKT